MKEILLTSGKVYTTPIIIDSNDTVIRADGVGDAPVISTPNNYAIRVVGKQNVTIDGISLTGSGGGIYVGPDQTTKVRSGNVKILNCDIQKLPFMTSGSGIFASAVNGMQILNCIIGDVGYNHNEEHNLYIGYGSGMVEIAYCTCYTSSTIPTAGANVQFFGQGFDFKNNNWWYSVHHNTIIGNKYCLSVHNLVKSEITNNVIVRTSDTLDYVWWGGGKPESVLFDKNVVM